MRKEADKLDCYVSVITPENIEFDYALAGPFQRLPAFLFDLLIRFSLLFVIGVASAILLGWLPFNGALTTVITILLFFALRWFYGIFFETRFNGRTPGKMIFMLRVISVDGRPINGVQAALRNMLRLADMGVLLSFQIFDNEAPPRYAIPTMIVGLNAMASTRRLQRIGDLAAGTMVVSENSRRSPWVIRPDDARAFGLADLVPATFQPSNSLAQTIALYMENRKRLSPMRRNEIARHIALPLIRRFELLPDTSPDLLLCALYVRVYLPEDQREIGRQRMKQLGPAFAPPPRPTIGKSPLVAMPAVASEAPLLATETPAEVNIPSQPHQPLTTPAADEPPEAPSSEGTN